MRRWMTAAAVVLVLATGAAAKDTAVEGALDDAKVFARKGETIKAAERFGDAIAIAHAAADLQAEESAANALVSFIGELPHPERLRPAPAAGPDAGKEPAAGDPTQLTALAAVMRRLDADRCGAYISAPVLARSVLLLATETGDTSGVADAAKVAAASGPKAGRASAIVARYAEGMEAALAKRFAEATGPLETAMKDAGKAGFFDLASHAGTELCAAWVGAGDAAKASAALEAVAALCDNSTSRDELQRWQQAVAARLADAPEAVRKPAADAFAKFLNKGGSASAAGGEGGKGGKGQLAGEEPISDVGRLFRKLGKTKPFVAVKCTQYGHDVRWMTAPDKKVVRPFEEGERHINEGGVTLAFSGRGVALRMVALVGRQGQPGDSSGQSIVRACYLLADGETWSVSKDGVVTISK